jgi:hypothetical protein
MGDSEAKIKIKVGAIEVDYEGDPAFLTSGLNELIKNVAEIHKEIPESRAVAQLAQKENGSKPLEHENGSSSITLTTSTIASRRDANSGPELAICAMAHLELVKGLAKCDRKSILEEMKSAGAYYKGTFSNNLSSNLSSLVKSKRINEVGSGIYCLTAGEKKKIEAAIAEHG